MCKRMPEDTWYSYVFRQVCEKSWAVLAISGFAVLYWYAERADRNEERLIELIREDHKFQSDMTQAVQELTQAIRLLDISNKK